MYREIRTQVEAWASALDAVKAAEPAIGTLFGSDARAREVLFLGAGSSYYLGLAAAVFWGRRGFKANALPASEQLFHADGYPYRQPPIVVAISRSGATTETRDAVRALRAAGSPCISISTEADSPIATEADLALVVTGGRESSIVQTRSFSGHLVATQALAAVAASDAPSVAALDDLPRAYQGWLERAEVIAQGLASRFERAYFLGTGERWGIAMEGALKLKEASLTETEAFQTFEFRHGPKSMIDDQTLVMGLVGGPHAGLELDVMREARELGARVVVVGEDLASLDGLEAVSFGSGLPEDVALPYHLPLLHLLAYHRAVAKRLDPDHPRHLDFAVLLEPT